MKHPFAILFLAAGSLACLGQPTSLNQLPPPQAPAPALAPESPTPAAPPAATPAPKHQHPAEVMSGGGGGIGGFGGRPAPQQPGIPGVSIPGAPAKPLPPPDTDQYGLLSEGLLHEEGDVDPARAIESYQQIVRDFDQRRPAAAQAIFRLAESYRKLGRTEEAKVQYARILREFTDQPQLAQLSQRQLSELGNLTHRLRPAHVIDRRTFPGELIGDVDPQLHQFLSRLNAIERDKTGWEVPTGQSLAAINAEIDRIETLLETVREAALNSMPEPAASDPTYQELFKKHLAEVLRTPQSQEDMKRTYESLAFWLNDIYIPRLQSTLNQLRAQAERQKARLDEQQRTFQRMPEVDRKW
jgi:tetratricopeptide (TPR) repeat protein